MERDQMTAPIDLSSPIDPVTVCEDTSHANPLGPTLTPDGVNFSVFSAHAKNVEIVLFENAEAEQPVRIISLSPTLDRTSHYWHIFVPGILAGQLYGYRVDGPCVAADGNRFDFRKVLIDPYGKSVSIGKNYKRSSACHPGDNAAHCMKSVVADLGAYNWQGDKPLKHPFLSTVIYEAHVAGFTRHPNSGVSEAKRGTYLGLIEKIPYLKDLGITAIELLPVFQFDAQNAAAGLEDYWGYGPVSFFAPHLGYSSSKDPLACLDEFRTMVKELHRAGIEVILDVVYNHTGEGDENGPTLCFRGLENSFYYILAKDKTHYANYTGAGNTLKANHSIVKRLILDSLRYWTSEMHVDGFRFDLASIFSRDETGKPMLNPPIIWEIDSDPVLAGTKLIAEAWDSGGLYQVGSFGQDKWKEWNGRFRDDIRSFVKGDEGAVTKLQNRLAGSPDLYDKGRPAGQSINFVTCHDGFTLNDLVSYDTKHNKANAASNTDGSNTNTSWNCGVEGHTDNPAIQQLRMQQIRNFFALTLLSVGTPMLLMGDEVCRTQGGNNNAYCQNNTISWFDWSLCDTNADLLRFVRTLIKLRVHFDRHTRIDEKSLEEYLARRRIEWHGIEVGTPDWGNDSHSLALSVHNFEGTQVRYLAINAYWEALEFHLPPAIGATHGGWVCLMDTAQPTPNDIGAVGTYTRILESRYLVNPRSIVMLGYDQQTSGTTTQQASKG
jgi:glycogen operon protein